MTNERLRHLLILAVASFLVAVACFYLGGVIAEAASANPIMGVTFKTGGALAGFVIAFVLLFFAYQRIGATSLMLKVTVSLQTGQFARTGTNYSAKVTILKRASGDRHEMDAGVIWEAGGMTVHLRDIEQDDLVMITVVDTYGGHWESDFFSPLSPSLTLA
jgi:hypothetical protein